MRDLDDSRAAVPGSLHSGELHPSIEKLAQSLSGVTSVAWLNIEYFMQRWFNCDTAGLRASVLTYPSQTALAALVLIMLVTLVYKDVKLSAERNAHRITKTTLATQQGHHQDDLLTDSFLLRAYNNSKKDQDNLMKECVDLTKKLYRYEESEARALQQKEEQNLLEGPDTSLKMLTQDHHTGQLSPLRLGWNAVQD
ncbi:hypothetical protein WJX73_005836 [Symbiochloris irregularis]|uniref:Uncharacterized protein n=1 Tax=Symbiochloris irregularis TaxID=706552 RepID=A0AAW1Q3G2_9CHLO